MKKLFISLMLLLPVIAVAQKTKCVELDRAISLKFSRTFNLPEEYLMNAFDYEVSFTMRTKEGQKPVYVKRAMIIPLITVYDEDRDLNKELKAAVNEWLDANGVVLPKDKASVLHFSPLYYAETGDKLYFTGKKVINNGAKGEEAGVFYRFHVCNSHNTPFYATVERNADELILNYRDSFAHMPFLVERYKISAPITIKKEGYQSYMYDNSELVHIRQFYKNDSLQYAEELDSATQTVQSIYRFGYVMGNHNPQLLTKEVLYPSGSVKVRTDYDSAPPRIFAFNEDGSEIKIIPDSEAKVAHISVNETTSNPEVKMTPAFSKSINKALKNYFKQNFKKPDIGRDRYGIYKMTLTLEMVGTVSEKGEMIVTKILDREDNGWRYQYDPKVIISPQVRTIVETYYSPYLEKFIYELTHTTLTCTPAKENNEPVSSPFVIKFMYSFRP